MRFVFSLVLFSLLLLLATKVTFACSCAEESPQEAFERSGAVFLGEFIRFIKNDKQGNQVDLLKFNVERQWKGKLTSEVILPYIDIPRMCGDLDFMKGSKYLIYASRRRGGTKLFRRWRYVVIVDCGRSRERKYADEDLKFLEKL